MVLDDVVKRGRFSVSIKGHTPIRDREVEYSTRAQHAKVSRECPEWVLCVLDEMVGDDEISRGIRLIL